MSFEDARRVYEQTGIGGDAGLGERPAVVVVDFSRAFTDPAHPLGADVSAEIAATNELLAVARAKRLPVLFTTVAFAADAVAGELWVRKLPVLAELLLDSELVEIDPLLERRADEPVVVKRGASAFFGTDLAERLAAQEVDTVVVCGVTTSGCIRATVVDALQHQLRALVPRECVGDRHAAPHEASLFDIAAKYGSVASVHEVRAYLERVPPRGAAGA